MARQTVGVMSVAEKVIVWIVHGLCSKNVYLSQYMLVVLLLEKATEC